MTVEAALFSRITDSGEDNAELYALLGDRFYPLKTPQGATHPHVRCTLITGLDHTTHNGRLGFEGDGYQLDVIGTDPDEVAQIASLLLARLNGRSWTAGGTTVTSCLNTDKRDLPEDPDSHLCGRYLEFDIKHFDP